MSVQPIPTTPLTVVSECPVCRHPSHIVVTGLLTVNLSSLEVSVDGVAVPLTATELRLLVYLAQRVGQAVSYTDILHDLWGAEGLQDRALVTMGTYRLRGKLGAAAPLLTTLVGTGIRLEHVTAGAPAPRPRRTYPRLTVWSRQYSQCRHCGTTTAPHGSHGYCQRWQCRKAYQLTRGQVAP